MEALVDVKPGSHWAELWDRGKAEVVVGVD